MKTTKTFLVLLATFLLLRSQITANSGEYTAVSPQLSLGEVTRTVLENNPAIKEAENLALNNFCFPMPRLARIRRRRSR